MLVISALALAGVLALSGCGDKKSDGGTSAATSAAPKVSENTKKLTDFLDGLAKDAKGTYDKQDKQVRFKGIVKYILDNPNGTDQVQVIDKTDEKRPYVVCVVEGTGLAPKQEIEVEGTLSLLWESESTIPARAKIEPCKIIK